MFLLTKEVVDAIFKDPSVRYDLTEFKGIGKKPEEILNIYSKPGTGKDSGKVKYYLKTLAPFHSGKDEIQVFVQNGKGAPEEIVRQLWVYKLTNYYGYDKEDIKLEEPVTFGSEGGTRFADIVVFSKDRLTPRLVFEIKKPNRKDGIDQLKSYMESKGAPIAVWSNGGSDRIVLYRPYPKDYDTLDEIPRKDQEIEQVLERKRTLADLSRDFDFKKILENVEELALANYGDGVFDEVFKLIFAKIYDEMEAEDRRNKEVLFAPSKDPQITYDIVNRLFQKASEKWPGIFKPGEKIELKPGQLSLCIGQIATVRLLGSNLRIMDDAFEYLIPSALKKKDGQFFTPRHVIDMCVRMLNPQPKEYVMDPACGSAGFLLHAMEWVYPAKTSEEMEKRKHKYASKYLWGIDISEKSARTSRALMLIAGDGHTNIFGPRISSLDPSDWLDVYTGQELMAALRREKLLKVMPDPTAVIRNGDDAWKYFEELCFDVIMANPPFAGEVPDRKTLIKYDLAKRALKRAKDKRAKEERDVLFVERILKMLKPGGRAAIVLPQGKFNNSSLAFIREWILRKARLLAVVGLHANTFKPHTGTKTSVLFVQKYSDQQLKKIEEIKVEIAALCPDYEKIIGDLLYKYQAADVPEEQIPDPIAVLLSELFSESEEEVPDVNGKEEENASSESSQMTALEKIDALDERIHELRDELLTAKQKLLDLSSDLEALEEKEKQEIALLEAQWTADKKTLTNEKKKLSSEFKTQRKALKENQKDQKKKLNTEISSLEKLIEGVEYDLKSATNRGRLELVLGDPDLIGRLKDRFVDGEVAKKLDYPIFMAVSEDGGKNSSGNYDYDLDENGDLKEDSISGMAVIKQDLINYEITKLQIESSFDQLREIEMKIAERFIAFAKTNGMQFWT